ncbi:MAG: response regulator transcription factor [Verrucomicrobia bacterium]|jgi:DNA-binding NarL/FixJ family response regulator|nr:response regulator transcription factor [Verrucomicrobiota bacterium]
MPDSDAQPPRPIRVSVVEDDASLRENLRHFLRLASDLQLVSEHDTAEAALRELPDLRPDVVLMDINLPGMSGIECVRRLKARLPEVQVLMVTVYDDGDRVFKALLAGANGYLLKASIASDIVPAVREVVRGGAPLNSFIARKVVQFFQQRPPEPKDDAGLTAREREVLELLAKGLTYKAIGAQLGISLDTVRRHCHHIYGKMHVASRTEAVVRYLEG